MSLDYETERIAKIIVDCAFKVHTKLGPGLLERVYEVCLLHELRKTGLKCQSQIPITINYDGIELEEAFRADILVEEKVLIELKALEQLHSSTEAQVLSYLRLTSKRLALLINFRTKYIKNGITRYVI